MDRFTRTREYYLTQHQAQGRHKDEAPTSSLTSPVFDFDFKDPRLDLTLDMENMVSTDSRSQPSDTRDTDIGVAVTKDPVSSERRRLIKRKPVPVASKTHGEPTMRDDVHTSVPPIPDDILVRFASRCNDGQKNPSCSITSKVWRRRFKDTITSPLKKASSMPTEDTRGDTKQAPSDKKTSTNFQEEHKVGDAKQRPPLSNEPAKGADKQTETPLSQPHQTNLLTESETLPHKKKFPIIKKMLSKLQF